MLPLLRDPAPDVRKRAFATVRRFWPVEVRDEMIRAIDDPDPELARLAVRSLGACYQGRSWPEDVRRWKDTDPVRASLTGVLFTQAELDAIPAEVRARSRWRSPDPIPIPGERQPAKLRAQAVLSLGQMHGHPECVAAILRALNDPHEEVVSAAAVAFLSPNVVTDEPTWARIADALLRALREKAARDPRELEPSETVVPYTNDHVKEAANQKWKNDRFVFSVEPSQTILRTLATRPELRLHARDAVPELIRSRPWICGHRKEESTPRYQPDVASPDTQDLPRQPFPRFRSNLITLDTLRYTRNPEWAGGVWPFAGLYFTSLMDRIGRANESDLPVLEKLLTLRTVDEDTRREAARAIVRTLATADEGPNRFDHIRGPKVHPLVVEMAVNYKRWGIATGSHRVGACRRPHFHYCWPSPWWSGKPHHRSHAAPTKNVVRLEVAPAAAIAPRHVSPADCVVHSLAATVAGGKE